MVPALSVGRPVIIYVDTHYPERPHLTREEIYSIAFYALGITAGIGLSAAALYLLIVMIGCYECGKGFTGAAWLKGYCRYHYCR
jgi:hypothetical protein